jgi:hypothetical protein
VIYLITRLSRGPEKMIRDKYACSTIGRMEDLRLVLEEIAFRQPSDIGYIRCRVAVSIGFCDVCEARSVDPGVDKIFDEAFQHEYGRALKRRRRCRPPVTARPSAAH